MENDPIEYDVDSSDTGLDIYPDKPHKVFFDGIDNEYSYGEYNSFCLFIMNKNGYINATRLCEAAGSDIGEPKKFGDWFKTDDAENMINIVNKKLRDSQIYERPIIEISTETKHSYLNGIYIHPILAVNLAAWISPICAINVSEIMDRFGMSKLNGKNKDSSAKIEQLAMKIKEVEKKNEELEEIIKSKNNVTSLGDIWRIVSNYDWIKPIVDVFTPTSCMAPR